MNTYPYMRDDVRRSLAGIQKGSVRSLYIVRERVSMVILKKSHVMPRYSVEDGPWRIFGVWVTWRHTGATPTHSDTLKFNAAHCELRKVYGQGEQISTPGRRVKILRCFLTFHQPGPWYCMISG